MIFSLSLILSIGYFVNVDARNAGTLIGCGSRVRCTHVTRPQIAHVPRPHFARRLPRQRKPALKGQCVTPSKQPGTCIYLSQCTEVYNVIRTQQLTPKQIQYLRQSQCGRYNGQVLICCPGVNQPSQPHSPGPKKPAQHGSSLFPQPGVCGKGAANRIFGGVDTDIGEYPWLALIEYSEGGKAYGFHCGGSLINNRYVLTAAHCIKGAAIPSDWSVSRVRLGEWNTDTAKDCKKDINGYEDCSDPPIDVPIESFIVHENYDGHSKNQYHDIALLRLANAVPYTEFISPVCLPVGNNLRSSNLDGSVFDVVGWGRTETASKSKIKQKAAVNSVDLNTCNSVFSKSQISLQSGQMCAGGQKGVDSCNGDSGGPLIGLDNSNKQKINYFLAGIVSFGTTSCGLEGWPGVYTRVGHYIDWLERNMKA